MINSDLQTSKLGNTGITVTRFSAGGHFTLGPSSHNDVPRRIKELNHLLDLGINYLDVQWEPEEEATAELMKTRKEEFTVCWPLHGVTQLGGDLTKEYILDYCQDHHKRYGIDHVDILLWVGLELYPESEDKVMHVLREATTKLKALGFCDHLAFSCHHSPQMAQHALTKFDDFEVMMVPYSALHPGVERELLPFAKSKGIGCVGMKPFGGAGGFFNKIWAGEMKWNTTDFGYQSCRPYQAAIRFALQNPNLDCAVPGMHSITQMDELYEALKHPLNEEDIQILDIMKKTMLESNVDVQIRRDGFEGLSKNIWD
jgi:aryl-alcohol dehydrogenase-like predicted oxidoreductase